MRDTKSSKAQPAREHETFLQMAAPDRRTKSSGLFVPKRSSKNSSPVLFAADTLKRPKSCNLLKSTCFTAENASHRFLQYSSTRNRFLLYSFSGADVTSDFSSSLWPEAGFSLTLALRPISLVLSVPKSKLPKSRVLSCEMCPTYTVLE